MPIPLQLAMVFEWQTYDNSHTFTTTSPVCAFTVGDNTYAAVSVSDVAFGQGETSTRSGTEVTISDLNQTRGDTVVAGNGIAISQPNVV